MVEHISAFGLFIIIVVRILKNNARLILHVTLLFGSAGHRPLWSPLAKFGLKISNWIVCHMFSYATAASPQTFRAHVVPCTCRCHGNGCKRPCPARRPRRGADSNIWQHLVIRNHQLFEQVLVRSCKLLFFVCFPPVFIHTQKGSFWMHYFIDSWSVIYKGGSMPVKSLSRVAVDRLILIWGFDAAVDHPQAAAALQCFPLLQQLGG